MMQDILQDSLTRLERGETLEQVLASCASAEAREELASLLALATNIHRAAPIMSENCSVAKIDRTYAAVSLRGGVAAEAISRQDRRLLRDRSQ